MARTTRNVDLIELVKACAQAGVSHLKMGSTEITFGGWKAWETPEVKTGPVEISKELGDNKTLGDRDEENLRELQTAEMMLLDPVGYEKLQLGEEI